MWTGLHYNNILYIVYYYYYYYYYMNYHNTGRHKKDPEEAARERIYQSDRAFAGWTGYHTSNLTGTLLIINKS